MSYAQFDRASQAPHFPSPQAPARRAARWLPLLGAGLGFAGLIAGVAGCSRPAATTEAAKPVYSDQQVADAKKAVCEDFDKGYRAVQVSLSKSPDTSTNATYSSVLLNARIAELGVANMLLHSLDANPATPPDLRDLVNQYGSLYQRIAITQLADGTAVEIDPMDAKVHELAPKIKQSCQ